MLYDNEVMTASQGLYNNKKSNYAAEDVYYGPKNIKTDPCVECPNFDSCAIKITDCKAMRQWCNTGNYSVADVMINIKEAA